MTFEAFETTDGQPGELITFLNGALAYRYTNSDVAIVLGANTFEPLAYKRTAPSISKDSDDTQIRITLPSNNPVVQLYREILQSNITTMTIERYHRNDPAEELQVYWKGEISSVTMSDSQATILATPLSQGTDELPRFTYQGSCNYFLFEDSTCRVARNSFRHDSTISTLLSSVQITVAGLRTKAAALDAAVSGSLSSDELDAYWLNGYCSVNGELRRIIRSPAGNSPLEPDTIEIPYPFNSVSVNDAISVFAGCSRSADICTRKYNNIVNFGGWPTVPKVNPFTTELPVGSRTSGGGFWKG